MRRILAVILALALMVSCLPVTGLTAYAAQLEDSAPVQTEESAPAQEDAPETAAPAEPETVEPEAVKPEEPAAPAEDPTEPSTDPEDPGRLVEKGSCGEDGDNVQWKLYDSGLLAITGTGRMRNYSNPDKTDIFCAPWNSLRGQIKTVTIGDGVTSIGDYAFYFCSLISIDISSSVTSIGNYAFGISSLKRVEFGADSHLQLIKSHAFYYCDGLEKVEFGANSQLQNIWEYAFEYCSSLTSIDIPSGVTHIGEYAFYDCSSLGRIRFLGNLPIVSKQAFYRVSAIAFYPEGNTTYRDVSNGFGSGSFKWFSDKLLPNSVLAEGDCGTGVYWTMTADGLLTITGTGEMTSHPWSDYKNAILHCVIKPGVTDIADRAFESCRNMKSLNIPASVTSIGSYAFYNCSSLDSIEIPASVTSIGDSAFYNCSSLGSIQIPSGVTSIGDSVFYNCSSLSSVQIPSGVTSIGDEAFRSCRRLEQVEFGDGSQLESIGDYTFYGCSSLGSIEIPASMTTIENYAFYDCSSLGSIEIPSGVTNIGDAAFSGCRRLERLEFAADSRLEGIGSCAFQSCSGLYSVVIPSSVTSIGGSAFGWCSNLESVEFETDSRLESIKSSAFYDCSNLGSIQIPSGVTSIGESAFYNCNSLCFIQIPSGVTSVGDYAFSGCSSLTGSIGIPSGVTSIGDYAFSGCSKLNGIEFEANILLQSIGKGVFGDCSSLGSIEIPASVTSIGDSAFSGCSKLKSIEFEADIQLQSIGKGVFRDCSSLGSIEIPSSVTSIEIYAFQDCSSLERVEFKADSQLQIIDGYAFMRCEKLTDFTIPANVGSMGTRVFEGCKNPKFLHFLGDKPVFNQGTFYNVRIVACYPEGNETYEMGVAVRYGGILLWVPESICSEAVSKVRNFGTCGEEAFWVLENDGKLTIFGSGDMYGSERYVNSTFPWQNEYVESVEIRNGVTSIGREAFYNCSSLASIEIPASVTSIQSAAFTGCSNLKDVRFLGDMPELNNAFSGLCIFAYCPDGNETYKMGLANNGNGFIMWMPDSIRSEVASKVYDWGSCGLASSGKPFWVLENSGKLTIFGGGSIRDYRDLIHYNRMGDPPWYAQREWITSVEIRSGVTGIGDYAFYECSSLGSIEIPSSVIGIGDFAFSGCSSLWKVRFLGDRPGVDSHAFFGVSAIGFYPEGNTTYQQIPNNFGGGSFQWLPDSTLKEEALGRGECGDGLYWQLDHNGLLIITGTGEMTSHPWSDYRMAIFHCVIMPGVTNIMDGAFKDCKRMQSISIPTSVTSIGDSAFYGCSSLESVKFGAGSQLQSIGSYAFYNCSSLVSVEIPTSVTSIGSYAFQNCSGLESIRIPASVTSIGSSAFSSCSSLERVEFGEGSQLESIGSYAFQNCSGLQSIRIPASVTSIGQYAFSGCSSLMAIYVASDNEYYMNDESGVLFNKTQTKLLAAPGKLSGAYTIPASVTGILSSAFEDCSSLKTVRFLGKPESIGFNAFYGVTATIYYRYAPGWESLANQNYGGKLTWVPDYGKPVELVYTGEPLFLEAGQFCDPATLSLKQIYDTTYEETITGKDGITVDSLDTNTPGEKTLTVHYGELTTKVTVYVHALDQSTLSELPESAHPYESDTSEVQTITLEGVMRLELTFSGNTFFGDGDTLYIMDAKGTQLGTYTGNALAGQTVTVSGDTAKLWLLGSGSGEEAYGYKLEKVVGISLHHDYEAVTTPATCTQDGRTVYTCFCGESYEETLPKLNHKWSEEWQHDETHHWHNCENDNCPVENDSEKDGYEEHQWNDWVIDQPATCTESGSKHRECQTCHYEEKETIGALNHNWSDEWQNNEEYHWHNCENPNCPVENDSEKDGYAQHNWGDWITEKEATCTEDGSQYRQCQTCQYKETQTISKLEHKWSSTWEHDENYHWHECENPNCPVENDSEKDGYEKHQWGEWVIDTEATCTESGSKHRECQTCHYEEKETIGALNHNWSEEWQNNEEYHWHNCENPNCPVKNDSEKDGYAQHNWGEWITEKEATCTEDGSKYRQCETCQYKETQTITKLNHKWSEEWQHDETHHWHNCENDNCPVENDSEKEGYEEHQWNDWVIDQPATCTESGSKHRECQTCHYEEKETIEALNHNWSDEWQNNEEYHWHNCENDNCPVENDSEKDGYEKHQWGEWVTEKEATCTEDGSKYRQCETCQYKETQTISKLNHNWSETWQNNEEYHWHECENKDCPVENDSEKGSYGPHDWDDWVIDQPATCTESGSKHRECQTCHYEEKETIEALNHNWSDEWQNNEEYHWHNCENPNCPVKNDSEKDGYEKHQWGEWVIDTEATCTESGSKHRECQTCHYEEKETIEALNHNWSETWQNNEEYHWHECENKDCPVENDSEKDGYAQHNWGDWVIDQPATCTESGSKHRECQTCHYEEKETIEALNHNWSSTWEHDEDYHWHECENDNCPEKDNTKKGDYGAHQWTEWTRDVEPTCAQPGSEHRSCTTCGYREDREVIETVHKWSSAWEHDDDYHWHNCENPGCPVENDSDKNSYGEHQWTDWEQETAPSAGADGVEYRECETCGYRQERTVHYVDTESTEWDYVEGGELSLHINAPMEDFAGVLMDGQPVEEGNYTVTEGSTVVTFHEDYLKTLDDGEHTVTVNFDDGSYAEVTLTIHATILGDADGDGELTASDLARMRRYIAGLEDGLRLEVLDLDGDGDVTATDLVKLSRRIAGLE